MNGEVQLIVSTGENNILQAMSASDLAAQGAVGSFRLTFVSQPFMTELMGQTLIIENALGQTQSREVTGVIVGSPTPGFTRLNFATDPATFDFRMSAGGFFNYGVASDYYIDLFENESISQNWKFQDLNNFTAQGAFTREFRVPFSDNNQKALGALFDVNVDAGSNNYFHYKLPAEIRVDTLPIATGYVRVRKVYKTMNRISEVELAFYAETPDLVRNIGEKKLSEIADLPSLNEEVSYANVTAPNAERHWTILDRGQLWSEGGEANTRSLQDPNTPVYPADLTPALNWWYLFNQIITDAGFDLVAGS
jgi:hypothetical protein